jgi:hypothetical protein
MVQGTSESVLEALLNSTEDLYGGGRTIVQDPGPPRNQDQNSVATAPAGLMAKCQHFQLSIHSPPLRICHIFTARQICYGI